MVQHNGDGGYWGATAFLRATGRDQPLDLPARPTPAPLLSGPVVRHCTVQDMTGDSWQFLTAEQLLDEGYIYDALANRWSKPLPSDWQDRVESEMLSMGAVRDADGHLWLPPVYKPSDLRRRGYTVRGGVSKLTPGALEQYARHKGVSGDYMQPQYRDEAIDREARAFRDSGGRRNDAVADAVPIVHAVTVDPNQMWLFEEL